MMWSKVWYLLIFVGWSRGVLCQISISQSPNPTLAGQDVTITCTTIDVTAPSGYDWYPESDSFYLDFSTCTIIGAARPYTPSGCSSHGTTHTASMVISPATAADNGKTWSCSTAASGTSNVLTLIVHPGVSSQITISQSPNPAIIGQDVTITCNTTEATVPFIIDWQVDADVLHIVFPGCSYSGASRPYEPSGCSSQGTTHTASMIISLATAADNGKTWSCSTAASRTSNVLTLIVHPDVLCQISISQSPNPAITGQDVTITCTTNDATAPISGIDWYPESDSFLLDVSTCTIIGAARPYTPSGCSSQGTTHTASMIISATTAADNGKTWSCSTAASGTSNVLTLSVHQGSGDDGEDEGLSGGAIAGIVIGVLFAFIVIVVAIAVCICRG